MQTTIEQNEMLSVIDKSGLEQTTSEYLKEKFQPFLDQANEWMERARGLVVTDETQSDLMKEARTARLALVKIRTECDKTRKDLKEDSLRYGKAVQSVYNVIESLIKPIEEHLMAQEKFKEILEQKRIAELRLERDKIAAPYTGYIIQNIDLGEITQTDFDNMIAGAKLQKEAADKKAKEEEEQRREMARKHEEEQQRIREENERLRIQLENERKEAREKLEAEMAERKKEEQRRQAELEKERAERERIESELRRKKIEEQRAETERLEAIEAEAAMKDKDKMADLIKKLSELPFLYQFKSKKHQQLHRSIIDLVKKTTDYATSKM